MYPLKRPYWCLECDTILYGHVAFFAHKESHDIDRGIYLKQQVKLLGGSFDKLLSSQPLFCYLCETLFIGSNEFYSHHISCHGIHLCCHLCSLRIVSLEELNLHVVAHTQNNMFQHIISKEESTNFLCVNCDAHVYGKTAFKEHFFLYHAMQSDSDDRKNNFDHPC